MTHCPTRARSSQFRRRAIGGVLAICAALASVHAMAAAADSIAVIDCTLIDDNATYNDAAVNREQQARLGLISNELRTQLDSRGLYRVVDNAPASGLIAHYASTQDIGSCNGCERDVARKLGAERVGICWVQKISNLILNINLRVEDVASGATVFERSVDIRGNNDLSWQRGVDALVGLVADERAPAH